MGESETRSPGTKEEAEKQPIAGREETPSGEPEPEKKAIAFELQELSLGPLKLKGVVKGRLGLAALLALGLALGVILAWWLLSQVEQLSPLISTAIDKAIAATLAARPTSSPPPIVVVSDLDSEDSLYPTSGEYRLFPGQEIMIVIENAAGQRFRWESDPGGFGVLKQHLDGDESAIFEAPEGNDQRGTVEVCVEDQSSHQCQPGTASDILIVTRLGSE